MNQLMIPTAWDKFRGRIYQIFKWPYFVFACFCYVLVILLVMTYLSRPPSYRSDLDMVLPGTGVSSNVSLDEVGQVVSSTSAPFASRGFSPRVNYKEILMSRGLIQRAAEQVNIDASRFGVPKIRLTDQTSIINVEIAGETPRQAQLKALALYDGLQAELGRLRADEIDRRDASIKEALKQYQMRLTSARGAITDFQQRSLLVSEDQLSKLIAMLSGIREKQFYVSAEINRISNYVTQLGSDLGVSAAMAGEAFKLQSDSQFLAYLTELQTSSSLLSQYRSRWGLGHPKVIAEQARFSQAKSALLERSEQLVGWNASQAFTGLDLQNNPKRAQLFADLIEAYASLQGEQARLNELRVSQSMLDDQLKVYSREAAELDRLQREFDLAEAVFTSAAARLEASKADIFASYPVIQLLTEPSLPDASSSPRKPLAIAAALFGIIFITSGLLVVNKRREIIAVVLKKPV